MRVRTILWPVIATACVLSGSAAMEATDTQLAGVVPARAQGEKLPAPRKCGARFGPIFRYCYSRELFAMETAPSSFHRTPGAVRRSA